MLPHHYLQSFARELPTRPDRTVNRITAKSDQGWCIPGSLTFEVELADVESGGGAFHADEIAAWRAVGWKRRMYLHSGLV